jgi:hypothetical protein
MKKSLVFLFASALFAGVMFAQTYEEEVDFYQSVFGEGKKAIVAEFIELDESAVNGFWSVYDEYEAARKVLGQSRLELLDDYADSYLELTDEKTDELVKSMVKQKKSLDKLIVRYYKKMKKTSGSKAAAQFYQLENYFLSAIRMEILDNIPFIGELDDGENKLNVRPPCLVLTFISNPVKANHGSKFNRFIKR